MTVLGFLFVLIVCCVVIWAARALMGAFGIGDPIATVVYVLLVIVLLYALAGALGFVHPVIRFS